MASSSWVSLCGGQWFHALQREASTRTGTFSLPSLCFASSIRGPFKIKHTFSSLSSFLFSFSFPQMTAVAITAGAPSFLYLPCLDQRMIQDVILSPFSINQSINQSINHSESLSLSFLRSLHSSVDHLG